MGGLLQKRGDARSALTGLLTGLAVTFLFSFWKPFVFPVSPGIIGLVCNAGLYFGMSVKHRGKLLERKAYGKMPGWKAKMKPLWIAIIVCFLLMGGPLIILLDHSGISIAHIPILYLFVFALWIALCILTFIGWRMRWGDEKE